MSKIFYGFAALSVVAMSPAAQALVITPGTNIGGPPSADFTVTGNPASGPVSANYGRSGLPATLSSTDQFVFTLLQTGLGSGTIATALSGVLNGSTDLDFLSVRFSNDAGATYSPVTLLGSPGPIEFGSLFNVPIFNGVLNILEVTYLSRGAGSYGGQLNFVPNRVAVPEPATWAMMLLGLGAIGFSMRRRNKQKVRVRYAF